MSEPRFISLRLDAGKRQSVVQGLKDAWPALIASGTWGFVTGIAMVKSGLTDSMATLMTVLVYAGSAQLTSLPLIESSSPLWLIFAAGTVVNIRFVIFAAALQPFFRHLSWFKRLLLGYLTSDFAFVLFMARHGEDRSKGTADQLWYMIAIVLSGWLVWNMCSLLGIFLGGFVPASWSLEFAAVLALMAIVIPLIKTRPMVVCLLVSGVIAWLAQSLPLRLGLAAAVVGGIAAGVLSEKRMHSQHKGRS